MKRKVICAITVLCLSMGITACGSTDSQETTSTSTTTTTETQTEQEEPPQIPNLIGQWEQTNKSEEADAMYQTASITENTITVNWVSSDSSYLYWAGTFVAPQTADEPYSWDSENDTEQTSTALLASGDDTKTFTYENNQISYEVSAMGSTQTVILEKVSDTPDVAEAETESTASDTTETAAADAGNLGDYYVTIKDCAFGEDYEGNKIIVVNYDFTNNSDETVSALLALNPTAFQDGVELEMAITMDDSVYNAGTAQKDIQSGVTLENCQAAYVLTSDSPVEFEVTEFIPMDDTKLTKTFEVQ